ncbi:MAG: phospholipid methyltransferase [Beijerinckiaceae bacterium]|jgi:phosphatidylethanolamine/phosphatidyl-N-methylethanolamine N-methyltransferase|nr:phospholipid methyltransferase [Beijerinckiaceae bacterium]
MAKRLALDVQLQDEARFLKSWFDRPLMTGAVSPSGKQLARTMARYVDVTVPGPVIELGPGTGPVTEALIRHGVAEERLILVEFNPDFCRLLHKRFPKATIIEGDAYRLQATLGPMMERAAAVVSSLPLFTRPEIQRTNLLQSSFNLMQPGAPFIQFTYATVSPIPLRNRDFDVEVSPRVWLNLPPARVWVYRKADEA